MEKLQHRQIYSYDFCLPDGLTCKWSFVQDNKDIRYIAGHFATYTFLTGQQARICTNFPTDWNGIDRFIKDLNLGVVTGYGGNRYFEQDVNNLENLKFEKWDNYDQNYFITPVNASEFGDKEVVRNLMVGSFGKTTEKIVHISTNFDNALRDPRNYVYLIKERESGLAIGAFVSRYLSELQEVQLHCVSGLSTDPRVLQMKGKLPIIVSAFMETVRLNYADQINGKDFYRGVNKITFSASGKVIDLYKNLGFKESTRSGMVISNR